MTEKWGLKSIRSNGWLVPKKSRVIYSRYDIDGYEGSAILVYELGDKYYLNEGSHCSCFGLEESWNPEEYDLKTLIAVIERRDESYYRKDENKIILRRLRRRYNASMAA